MKKVGILFGMEDTFPWAFIDEVNRIGKGKVFAEAVKIDKVEQGVPSGYDVIVDRISQDIPFYRAWVKNAALTGTTVINNPFWFSADEKFFNNCLAKQLGVPVPNTILLPSNERPNDTTEKSFRNLAFPLDWEYIFDYVGFPAYMKPHSGGGWKNVYRLENKDELFDALQETGQLVMLLQEEIVFEDYYRVYCVGRKYVHIMPYDPRNPHHLRYATEPKTKGEAHKKLLKTIEDYTLRLNNALGYDLNTVEFAIKDGIPYAIDFCNPAPDADINSVGQQNFDWVVEHMAKFAVEKALETEKGKTFTTWGNFVRNSILSADSKKTTTKIPTKTQATKNTKTTKNKTTPKKA